MDSKTLFRALVAGLGGLAGIQFWILTESIVVGGLVGATAWGFLVWFIKGLDRRTERKKRFIGEVKEGIVEDDFINPVKTERYNKERLRDQVKKEPQHLANSVRAMLVKDKTHKK